MKVTLFVPFRNEIVGLKYILPRIKPEWVDEWVFMDGNSTDGSKEYVESLGHKVLPQISKGLGGAYWEAIQHMSGDIVIPFSPDNNSLPEAIPALVAKVKEGYDLVIASRYLKGARSEDDSLVTKFGNWMFTKMVNWFFGARYTDTLVMFRAFRRELLFKVDMDLTVLPIFEYQMAIRFARLGLRVTEIPVTEFARLGGKPKMRPIYNGLCLLYIFFVELGRRIFSPLRYRESEPQSTLTSIK